MLVESSTFHDCQSTSNAGGIMKSNGECIVNKCCSLKCYSIERLGGQFLYTVLSHDPNKKNQVLDSSISHSMKDSKTRSYGEVMGLYMGTIQIKTVNLSNNICETYTVSAPQPYVTTESASSNAKCSISYCSFNSNVGAIVFTLNTDNVYYSVSKSNVIYNIDTSKICLLYSSLGDFTDCCIMENDAKNLFLCNRGYVYVINCSIDVELNTQENSIIVDNYEGLKSFIVSMVFTAKDGYCNASYDSVDGITVDIPDSLSNFTPEEYMNSKIKIIHLYLICISEQ